ncbi:hypothetical protein KEM55_001889 [Ascosphaera atra]|nr:hypothetical protein KEM55_001889 [Ascosphaera atra]
MTSASTNLSRNLLAVKKARSRRMRIRNKLPGSVTSNTSTAQARQQQRGTTSEPATEIVARLSATSIQQAPDDVTPSRSAAGHNLCSLDCKNYAVDDPNLLQEVCVELDDDENRDYQEPPSFRVTGKVGYIVSHTWEANYLRGATWHGGTHKYTSGT